MNLFDLYAKISLDDTEYKKGISGAKSTFSGLVSSVGNGLKTAAKVGGAALAAGTAALAGFSKLAIDSYAEFEQVAGGATLMFGDAYSTVAKNAKEAYSTVQMSQTEYLKQANGFATGLKTALGGNEKAAADLAHRIIQAEADIIAATGNTQENIQNAFNGIMKSNFTMLDNLQIGITPTKEGFQEVIDKVNEWNEANGNATNYQIDNLADAQNALVDYIEMVGMSGYAQAEAAGTISGAYASMKAAWSNFVLGFSDPSQDLGILTQNLVDSALQTASLIGPRLMEILPNITKGMGQLAAQALPVISKFIKDYGTPMLKAVVDLINGITKQVPVFLENALEALPELVSAAASILGNLGNALLNLAPELFAQIREMIISVNWVAVGDDVADGLAKIDWAGIVSDFFSTIGVAFGALGGFIVGLFSDAWNAVVEYLSSWVETGESMGMDTASALLYGLLQGLGDIVSWIYTNLIEPLIEGIIDGALGAEGAGKEVVASIKKGISDAWNGLVSWFNTLWDSLFGNRQVNVSTNTSGKIIRYTPSGDPVYANGSHASGLSYVPFDGYIAQLHEGERVLTKTEARDYRNGISGSPINIIVNGARYEDEESLAQKISYELQNELDRRKMSLA